jgi:hypothetical protein
MSDSEMVERVTRAMSAADPMGPEYPVQLQFYIPMARAAIAAMREPTEDMKAVGASQMRTYNESDDVWQAMIDEALK